MLEPQFLERALVRAADGDFDLAARCLLDARRARGATTVDEVLAHALVARPELGAAGQLDAGRQARGGNVGATGRHLLDRRFTRAHGVEAQRHAEVVRELAGEVVGRALGPLAAQVIGVRAVAGDDAQFTLLEDLLQQRRRLAAGGQQQGRQQCQEDSHAWRGPPRIVPSTVTGRAGGAPRPAAIECAALDGEVPKRS